MPKTQYVMEPVEIKVAELRAAAEASPAIKRYVDALAQFLPSDPEAVAGSVSVQGYNGLPVLQFKPRRTAIADLIKGTLK